MCAQVVIELVLATDMKQHFSILSHFTTVHRLNAGGAMTPGTSGSDPMLTLRQQTRCVRVSVQRRHVALCALIGRVLFLNSALCSHSCVPANPPTYHK